MIKITQIVCPCCGKFAPMDFSFPEEADLYAVEVKGLGRGRGVKIIDRYSILEPGNTNAEEIGERLLELLGAFLTRDVISMDDLRAALPEGSLDDVDEFNTRVADLETIIEDLTEVAIVSVTFSGI